MIIGLTGGIGSGKSTVAQFFKDLGVPVISSDQIAHQLLVPNHPAFKMVIEHFGSEILDSDSNINRKKLGSIVFQDPKARLWLESLLHPLIKQEIQTWCAAIPLNQYGVVEIPLLIEANFQNTVDKILVVDCPEDVQIQRVDLRNRSFAYDVKPILNIQTSRSNRINHATEIIENTGSMETLKQKVKALHQNYMELCK